MTLFALFEKRDSQHRFTAIFVAMFVETVYICASRGGRFFFSLSLSRVLRGPRTAARYLRDYKFYLVLTVGTDSFFVTSGGTYFIFFRVTGAVSKGTM